MSKKISIEIAKIEDFLNPNVEFGWKHGVMIQMPIDVIEKNTWNPNVMSEEEFNLLAENVGDVGFLDPVLVVPVGRIVGELQKFRIIDGEHRYEQQLLDDVTSISVIVADPERFDEKEQMRQTARMNNIKGHMDKRKFRDFADKLITKHGIPVDEVAYELGFADQSKFDALMDNARESLPNEEAKKEFDEIKESIKTIDDLSIILNKLFSKYGDTLPYNFMLLDFGGKDSIWVRHDKKKFNDVVNVAKQCQKIGVTFDSVIECMLLKNDISQFIEENKKALKEAEVGNMQGIDDLFGEENG